MSETDRPYNRAPSVRDLVNLAGDTTPDSTAQVDAVEVYVATLDTGGISHGGREIVGVASTEDGAKAAVVRKLKRGRPSFTTAHGDRLVTITDVEEYFGIHVYGPMGLGEAVEA